MNRKGIMKIKEFTDKLVELRSQKKIKKLKRFILN